MDDKKTDKNVITNVDFADKVGVHFSMASKLRNGHRAPSLPTLINIWDAFGLPAEELLDASRGGPGTFGKYLREHVFQEDEGLPEAVPA